ncbi:glutathione peroxidase [Reyranella aquatilis]|uniref:Glutathione peroxidase n=1 Tax=Reyranella aquatilis TaxID=2035356 RepID=A0ABS8L3P5_9HYPH|nr:glutathione peroxidase [Reyranella aquatilis]MCC8432973.1 glutathione peroxidase [Reyranella aquatilis]
MKLLRLLAFAVAGALLSAAAWSQAGRQPVDWAGVSLESIGGGPLPTSDYAGKVVLLVNTASLCGFTGQYKGLEELWRRYRDKGLVVLGVPSNDFGSQEPGSKEEIKRFCEASFDVTFPLADKQIVSGPNAHPLYRWAAAQTGTIGTPSWNFHKILIGRDGRVIDWFTAVSGTGSKLERAIEAALARPTSS